MRVYLLILFFLTTAIATSAEPVLNKIWEQKYDFRVKYAKFSPDGQFIYAVNGNNIEKISAETGEILKQFDNNGQIFGIYDFDISPQGNYLVTAHSGDGAGVWSTTEEKLLYNISYSGENPAGVESVTVSPDESTLIIGINPENKLEKDLVLWDLNEKKEISRFSQDGYINLVRYSNDGKKLAIGAYKEKPDVQNEYLGFITLWDTENWEVIDVINNGEGTRPYKFIDFSKNGNYLISVHKNGISAQIYKLSNLELAYNATSSCYDLRMLPDNEHFLVNFVDSDFSIDLLNFHELVTSFHIPVAVMDIVEINNRILLYYNSGLNNAENFLYEFDLPDGVSDNDNTDNSFFNIIDNGSNIQIDLSEIIPYEIEIQIYDLAGKLIFHDFIDSGINQITLPIKIPSGIYIFNLNTPTETYSRKFSVGGK